eukprot:scaffold48979_cov29-Tisochrysis_lutea.AAC.4
MDLFKALRPLFQGSKPSIIKHAGETCDEESPPSQQELNRSEWPPCCMAVVMQGARGEVAIGWRRERQAARHGDPFTLCARRRSMNGKRRRRPRGARPLGVRQQARSAPCL